MFEFVQYFAFFDKAQFGTRNFCCGIETFFQIVHFGGQHLVAVAQELVFLLHGLCFFLDVGVLLAQTAVRLSDLELEDAQNDEQ